MEYGKRVKYAGVLGLALLVTILSGCFMPSSSGVLVTPVVRALGLPDASIVDSVTLKVTGPDMTPVEVSYSQLPSVINISIPEGTSRQFELTVGLSSTFTSNPAIPYTSYKGTATADVTSDSTVVTLNMGIGSTKIIVPDEYNSRIVQIDDMSGTGWTTLQGSIMAVFGNVDSNFMPVDVDFDQYGNIFVANNNSVYTGIYKFTSIADTVPVLILKPSTATGMTAVALDRTNDRIYGLYGSSVIWSDYAGSLTGGTVFNYISGNLSTINGITVDDEGYVYLCGQDASNDMVIEKYSMSGGNPVETYLGVGTPPAMDVTILNGILYASVFTAGVSARVEDFNPDNLNAGPVGSYGSYSYTPSAAAKFAGPHNFLATMNNHLTLIDNYYDFTSGGVARVVSFDDITGTGWTVYGVPGTGAGQFHFFYDFAPPAQ